MRLRVISVVFSSGASIARQANGCECRVKVALKALGPSLICGLLINAQNIDALAIRGFVAHYDAVRLLELVAVTYVGKAQLHPSFLLVNSRFGQ